MRQGTAQIETCRIAKHHTRKKQLFGLLGLINTLKTGKLETVVHAVRFADTRRMNGSNFTPFVIRHRNDIGDVVFTLRIIVVELRQPAFHIRAVGNQDTGVNFRDLALFLAGIFVFYDAGHLAVFAGDAAIAARVVQYDGEKANTALGFSFTQAGQGFNGDQRDIAVQHQNVFVIGKERGRLLHRMASSQLFSLKHPVELVVTQRLFQ